jgi:hypothetical protein
MIAVVTRKPSGWKWKLRQISNSSSELILLVIPQAGQGMLKKCCMGQMIISNPLVGMNNKTRMAKRAKTRIRCCLRTSPIAFIYR